MGKKQYVDKSVELRAEWKTAMEEYKKSEQYTGFLAVLKQWNEDQMKDEEDEEKKSDDNKDDKKEEAVANTDADKDKEEEAVASDATADSDKENKDPKARGKK